MRNCAKHEAKVVTCLRDDLSNCILTKSICIANPDNSHILVILTSIRFHCIPFIYLSESFLHYSSLQTARPRFQPTR